jgi:ABC-type uncharacterized transport system fused permease/ATPase subunit
MILLIIVFNALLDTILILMEFVLKLVINVALGVILQEPVHPAMEAIDFMDQLVFWEFLIVFLIQASSVLVAMQDTI